MNNEPRQPGRVKTLTLANNSTSPRLSWLSFYANEISIMEKKLISWAECGKCGSPEVYAFTSATDHDYVEDGDRLACGECDHPGNVHVREDGTAWDDWHEQSCEGCELCCA